MKLYEVNQAIEDIFERMVDYIFGTEKDLTKFNPKATWKIFKPEAKEKDA